ncbi:hypothetical protein V1281_004106 [Nitrobacteraceae bacterium AZCC 2161]
METIGRDLNEMQRVPLAESHVAALRAAGTVAHYAAGTFLVQPGAPVDRFVYVEDGEIEVVNPFTDERHIPHPDRSTRQRSALPTALVCEPWRWSR